MKKRLNTAVMMIIGLLLHVGFVCASIPKQSGIFEILTDGVCLTGTPFASHEQYNLIFAVSQTGGINTYTGGAYTLYAGYIAQLDISKRITPFESAVALSIDAPVFAPVSTEITMTVTPLRADKITLARYYTSDISLSADSNAIIMTPIHFFSYDKHIDSIHPAEIPITCTALENVSLTAQTLSTSTIVFATKRIRFVAKETDAQRINPQSDTITITAPDGSSFSGDRANIPETMNIALALPLEIPANQSDSWHCHPTGTARELIDIKGTGALSNTPQSTDIAPSSLTFPFPYPDENNYKIFYYNAGLNKWGQVPGNQIVRKDSKTITATVTRLGIYQLMATYAAHDLSNVKVYPNPYRPQQAVEGVLKIINLPPDAEMTIYTIAGEKVITLHENDFGNGGFISWNGKNNDNNSVAQGMYLYHIKSNSSHKTGKFALIK